MKLLRQTTALCRRCHSSHPADVVIRDGKVIGIVHCADRDDEVELSSNPELYIELTGRSSTRINELPPAGLKFVLNYLSITNACNFHCTVCGANAGGPGKHTFLTVDEICRRAREAREQGARILHLFGGEPTLHPALLTIIRQLTGLGLSVGLVTNGFRLGREPEFASALQRSGLKRVCLQFDSLQQASLEVLSRGFLEEKKQAIRHVLDAGLHLGLNCTATRQTLSEMGELVEHGLSLGSGVRNMTFGCAAPVGRFLISEGDTVDREQIVTALTGAQGGRFFGLEDVLPLPAFLPWGLQVHPDCGVHILLLRFPGRACPLNDYVDLRRLYHRLSAQRGRANFFSTRGLPLLQLCLSVRVRRLPALLSWAAGIVLRKDGYGFLNIAITDYRAAAFLDEQRLGRCASAFHTSVGPVRSCLHFFQRPDIPGSVESEAAHQSC